MMINKILVKIMIMTLNHKVDGSSPSGHTNSFAILEEIESRLSQ